MRAAPNVPGRPAPTTHYRHEGTNDDATRTQILDQLRPTAVFPKYVSRGGHIRQVDPEEVPAWVADVALRTAVAVAEER